MKVFTAIFSLTCVFVGLAAASPTHTGLALSQGNGELSTRSSYQNWVDMNTSQSLCSHVTFASTQAGIAVSHSSWSGIIKDCQNLRSQATSEYGNVIVTNDSSSSPVTVFSNGSCALQITDAPEPFSLGNYDIVNILDLALRHMTNVTTPDEQFTSITGYTSCLFPVPRTIPWNVTLQSSTSTDHKASLAKRTVNKVWEKTPDTPEDMCSDNTNVTMLPGNPGVDFLDITHDCQALQATYNSSNEGYWNITLDDDSVNFFSPLDSYGNCSLLYIVLGTPKLPVTFQVGNTDIFDIVGSSIELLATQGPKNNTVAVSGRMGCNGIDNAVQVMWSLAFDDLQSGSVDLAISRNSWRGN
ncbi:hypothetical protein VMCG_07578 [Cytospora schulzeri]|uniref:Ecp2 effector protein-like domain-containing protein n=1 Tax=Cytospora schulzeri TaxID=448051 RepID=A0A423VXJ9_9PEZI|nr:hypothetical protein VMCG_07578 [Valsa malicola]